MPYIAVKGYAVCTYVGNDVIYALGGMVNGQDCFGDEQDAHIFETFSEADTVKQQIAMRNIGFDFVVVPITKRKLRGN